jgi:hypothetical protein
VLRLPPLAVQVGKLLNRMQLQTEVLEGGKLRVHVPPQRSDILHPVDVAEVRGPRPDLSGGGGSNTPYHASIRADLQCDTSCS